VLAGRKQIRTASICRTFVLFDLCSPVRCRRKRSPGHLVHRRPYSRGQIEGYESQKRVRSHGTRYYRVIYPGITLGVS
jgi:hypothetical protein